ncbi:MAG TPA: Lrp/AsnC family transcriptional regulator [Paraburkholderia sp.]|uniref:Lrp/AsnC family transcriptional regulator n=1 Tax=Paraburkholderia sp. TaxID=1926495 RepID=UPI002ED1BF74
MIDGYRAHINPAKVGLNFSAIVFATLRESTSKSVRSFESALIDIPEIIRAERLFGDPDFMLHIVTRDLAAFQKLYDKHLSALPFVLRLRSTLVMKSIFDNRPVPL